MGLTLRNSFPGDSGTLSCEPSSPTGVANDDLVLLLTVTGVDQVVTVPGEFVKIQEITGTFRTTLWGKIANNEGDSYRVRWDSGTGEAFCCAIDSTTLLYPVIHQINIASSGVASTNKVWNGVNNTDTNTLLMCFGGFGTSAASTPDAAMTERFDSGTNRAYLMTQPVAASGATGTRTATGTSVASQKCITVSISESDIYPFTYSAEVDVTGEIVLVELDPNPSLELTQIMTFAELAAFGIYSTQLITLAELAAVGIYLSQMMTLVEIEENPLDYYAVADGHNMPSSSLARIMPQPQGAGILVTRKVLSHNRQAEDEFLYSFLRFNVLGGRQGYQDLLDQFGLLVDKENDVTLNLKHDELGWSRYNATVVRPKQKDDIRWNMPFPRQIVILAKYLELSA